MQALIQKLKILKKPFFTFSDIQKAGGLNPASLKVTLSRAVKKGLVQRLQKGFYALPDSSINPRELSSLLYFPSYISFETALAEYGILSQILYTITCATIKQSKRFQIAGTELEYRQLTKSLFFGWEKQGNTLIASPEKALLDTLYLVARGKLRIRIDQFDLRSINKKKLALMGKQFPTNVQLKLKLVV